MALAAYRSLLRAARTTFQGTLPSKKNLVIANQPWPGDGYVLNAALTETRRGFEVHRGAAAGSEEAQALIKEAHDIAKILRTNVVQGKLNVDGRYSKGAPYWQAGQGQRG